MFFIYKISFKNNHNSQIHIYITSIYDSLITFHLLFTFTNRYLHVIWSSKGGQFRDCADVTVISTFIYLLCSSLLSFHFVHFCYLMKCEWKFATENFIFIMNAIIVFWELPFTIFYSLFTIFIHIFLLAWMLCTRNLYATIKTYTNILKTSQLNMLFEIETD